VLSCLLLGSWLSAGSVLAAVVRFEVVNWPYSTLTLQDASADVSEPDRHTKAKPTAMESRTPHLDFHNSIGAINEPLPLGIILNDSFGGETLILSGLPAGAKLSAGTDLGSTRWSVLGRDLDHAFIAAPENFSGSMQVTAKLYSSGNTVLEARNIYYKWTDGHTEKQSGTVGLAGGAHVISDLAVEERDAIRFSHRAAPFLAYGADAPTPTTSIRHSESSTQEWRVLGLSSANWMSQITFGQRPLAQVSGSRPSNLKR
jgi:hypothetical protein